MLPIFWETLRPHPIQWDLFSSRARFIGCDAGRRSGKTEITKRKFVMETISPVMWNGQSKTYRRYLVGGPTQSQTDGLWWQKLISMYPKGYVASIDRTHGRFWVKSGTSHISEIKVSGLDASERIEGHGIDGALIDESCDVKPDAINISIWPMISETGGFLWRIGIPKRQGVGAASFKQWCEDCLNGNFLGFSSARFTWASADILDPQEIALARATLASRDFREQYEASWESAGGNVYYAFDQRVNVTQCKYDPTKPIIISQDFNIDPMTMVIVQDFGTHMNVIDEIFLHNSNTPEIMNVAAGKMQALGHQAGYRMCGDWNSKKKNTVGEASLTDMSLIENDARFSPKAMCYVTNPPLVNRFASTNAMLKDANGIPHLFIDPKCKYLIKDLDSRYYEPGTSKPADGKYQGHICDAMDYSVWRFHPALVAPPPPGGLTTRRFG